MKILIIGDKSYVGINFKHWLSQWPDKYRVYSITARNDSWKSEDFSKYDVLFHVAAIVHQKEKAEMQSLYYKINRDLAIEIAKKAKLEGVKQFIFMSSMAVYGLEGMIGKDVIIDENTSCNPNTFYGRSKLEAEVELNSLNDDTFKVAILRAPMVYGNDCPGNYEKLKKLLSFIRVFPYVDNKRSMISIETLCSSINNIIINHSFGIYHPQDEEYMSTPKLVRLYMDETGKKVYMSRCIGFIVLKYGKSFTVLNKLFGNLMYSKDLQ